MATTDPMFARHGFDFAAEILQGVESAKDRSGWAAMIARKISVVRASCLFCPVLCFGLQSLARTCGFAFLATVRAFHKDSRFAIAHSKSRNEQNRATIQFLT